MLILFLFKVSSLFLKKDAQNFLDDQRAWKGERGRFEGWSSESSKIVFLFSEENKHIYSYFYGLFLCDCSSRISTISLTIQLSLKHENTKSIIGYPPPSSQFLHLLSEIVLLHLLCFISNVYKQRFLGLVEFLKKN